MNNSFKSIKVGVKRQCCWLIIAASLICLDTFVSSVKAESYGQKKRDKITFNYESLTNTWNYEDLKNKIEKEKQRELLISHFNGLNSPELIADQKIKIDAPIQQYEISSSYILPKFRNLTDPTKKVTQQNKIEKNITTRSLNSFDKKLQGNTDFLLADEPLPPSQQGIFWNPARPDSHAPIAVMGEHIHSEGEIMVSYRYMLMEMEGSRVGTDDISDEKILACIIHERIKNKHESLMQSGIWRFDSNNSL